MTAPGHDGGGAPAAPAHVGPRQQWKRLGAFAGFVAAVVILADLIVLSSSPPVAAPSPEMADYLDTNATITLVMTFLSALGCVLLLPFLAALRTFVHGRADEAEWRWTVTLLNGAVAVSLLLVGCATRGAAALLADRRTDPAAVSALFGVTKVLFSISLVPLAAVVLANARTMSSSRTPLRWFVRFSWEIGVLSLLSAATVFFADNDWFGPGEPVVAIMGFFLSLWLIAASFTILQGQAAGA